jgi:hypothetical protein
MPGIEARHTPGTFREKHAITAYNFGGTRSELANSVAEIQS